MHSRVFMNGNGERAWRVPDLQVAECSSGSCGCLFYVESPVDAVHCPRCGAQGVRVGVDWVKPESFLMQEKRGIAQLVSLAGDNDDDESTDDGAQPKE